MCYLNTPGKNIATSTLCERDLLILISKGDEAAFKKIFDAYRSKIYSYALHLTEDRTIADEILQEVFLKLWINRETITKVININAWLHTIAKNCVFDALKAIAKERTSRKGIVDIIPATTNNVEDTMLDKEYAQLLQQALSRLSPQQQLIYNLSRNDGAKHAEIACQLNISRNTVKTHLVHALKNIRQHLDLHSNTFIVLIFIAETIK